MKTNALSQPLRPQSPAQRRRAAAFSPFLTAHPLPSVLPRPLSLCSPSDLLSAAALATRQGRHALAAELVEQAQGVRK